MVLVITTIHIAMEAGVLAPGLERELEGVHHLPVVLYIAPVAYAGFSYGWEGGVLTGLWVGALASMNIVVWHLSNYAWVFELTFILVVITLGALLAIPVERERLQRKRAESAARRLETINQVAAAPSKPGSTPSETVEPALRRLKDLLSLKDVGVALWQREHPERVIEATATGETDFMEDYRGLLDGLQSSGVGVSTPSTGIVTVDTEHMRGLLVAQAEDELSEEEKDLLVTIANELAVRAENAMLVRQEQEMLSTYVRLVTKAQEEERKRLARDLHDGTAQQLAMLVRDLKQHSLDNGDPIFHLHESATDILEEVRRVARDQRPSLLDDLGLLSALEWLVDARNVRSAARATLTVVGTARRLPAEIEVALYRITQEALTNAERHADATSIQITVTFDQDIIISIEDDGRGFEMHLSTSDHVHAGRLGLMGMQERAQLIGGELKIHTSPDEGTTISVCVPLSEEDAAVD